MKAVTLIVLWGLLIFLISGCAIKEKKNTLGEFFDAVGSGNIEFIKKLKNKQSEQDEEKAWEEVNGTE